MTTMDKIRRRALETPLPMTESKRLCLLEWFQNNPNDDDCYVFSDGHIESGEKMRGRMTSRNAQLVSILIDGIPVNWSRWAIENRKTTND